MTCNEERDICLAYLYEDECNYLHKRCIDICIHICLTEDCITICKEGEGEGTGDWDLTF